MKTTLVLLCLAMFVAAVFAECNPNTNGMPVCTADSVGRYRNNFDPTHYWECQGNTAVSVPCDFGGFDSEKSACVAWSTWQWVNPCPEDA